MRVILSVRHTEYAPSAALTIKTGQPVMPSGSVILMKIEKEDGISGWTCKVNRGTETKTIKLKLENNSVSLVFQPKSLHVPETIFWCTDRDGESRSNQIIVWTSGRPKVHLMFCCSSNHNTYPSRKWGSETDNFFFNSLVNS